MHFKFTAAALLAMAASVFGSDPTKDFDSIFKPTVDQVVQAGSTVEIAWTIFNEVKYKNVNVDIQVLGGKSFNLLQDPKTIASGVKNSDLKYEWKVDSSLGNEKQYGIKILLSSDKEIYQWSPKFTIKKAAGSSSSADVSSTTLTISETKSESATLSSASSISSATSTKVDKSTTLVQTTANTVAPSTGTSTSTSTGTGSSTSSQPTTTPTTPPSGAAQKAAPLLAALGGVVAAMFIL